MVDAVSLILGEGAGHHGVHLAGAVEVPADRLFHDDAREQTMVIRRGDHASFFQMGDGHFHQVRRNRQVVDPAAGNAELLIDGLELRLELGVGPGIVEAALHIEQRTGEVLPVTVLERLPGELGDAVAGPRPEPFVRITRGADAEADHGEVGRQHAVLVQIVDGGQQFPPG